MTRDEALTKLKELKEASDLWGCVEASKALGVAIEALSSEAVSEDTQIKTELAHIKTRLENVEKRLQGLILYGGVIR